MCVIGLDEKFDSVVGDFFYGQQQVLELVMVLVLEFCVVLLDEFIVGFIKVECIQIGGVLFLFVFKYWLCCLLVEYDFDFVQQIVICIVVLYQGVIVMEGSFEEVVNLELVNIIYLGSIYVMEV